MDRITSEDIAYESIQSWLSKHREESIYVRLTYEMDGLALMMTRQTETEKHKVKHFILYNTIDRTDVDPELIILSNLDSMYEKLKEA